MLLSNFITEWWLYSCISFLNCWLVVYSPLLKIIKLTTNTMWEIRVISRAWWPWWKEAKFHYSDKMINAIVSKGMSQGLTESIERNKNFIEGPLHTGQSKETRRLVVAISLSGSAVSFSLTEERAQNAKPISLLISNILWQWTGSSNKKHFILIITLLKQ